MPPSQLKRLKASLREKGVVGPQKSKKQKLAARKSGQAAEGRQRRSETLQDIRDTFNPFEVKAPARPSKYTFKNAGLANGSIKGVVGRPGVTRSLGEENRRKTLLKEMERRQKVGGLIDRRFGENDPTMTPEEKALERFMREKQKGGRKANKFNLDDEDEEDKDGEGLTHFGRSLALMDDGGQDDFNEEISGNSDDGIGGEEADLEAERRSRKRRRLSDEEDGMVTGGSDEAGDRPKTKQEVMKELIAKSKYYKYERQKVQEDDDELRAELDKGLPAIYALMGGKNERPPAPKSLEKPTLEPTVNPDRAALLSGKDRAQADREYDERLKQMAFDARSKPTERIKSEEEKLEEEAERLKEMERKRVARMRGEEESESEDDKRRKKVTKEVEEIEIEDDVDPLGLGPGLQARASRAELDVEDEDEFVLDDIIASDSEADSAPEDEDESSSDEEEEEDDEEKEFIAGLVSKDDAGRLGLDASVTNGPMKSVNDVESRLAYTYPCPQTHEEFLQITKSASPEEIPIIIQRIRALYHPKLDAKHKEKLAVFSAVLVDHAYWLGQQLTPPPAILVETIIRHIHSLAKSFPEDVSRAFRRYLKSIQDTRMRAPTSGDLILLTAIGSIYPTSDHFHQVVTPANLSMASYLSQALPLSLSDLARGTYVATLMLQYQSFAKRYVPEVVNYVLNVLCALSPIKPSRSLGNFPVRVPFENFRLPQTRQSQHDSGSSKLNFWHAIAADPSSSEDDDDHDLKLSLLMTSLELVDAMVSLWNDKSAFSEIFEPFSNVLHFLLKRCSTFLPTATTKKIASIRESLQISMEKHQSSRKPLRLHNHRPLPIKSSIPKFEDLYDPTKHYDPDRERSDLSKLKAEHKRERKGALRELRKDANFIARERLREKKETDEAYEKKYKRLVAEIQGEEAREGKAYERVKEGRKRAKKN
ncbi:nucleolar complex protein 14 [Agyrium rufum]|nr:nucleolar complex protein 14 [Agyrium rufum]